MNAILDVIEPVVSYIEAGGPFMVPLVLATISMWHALGERYALLQDDLVKAAVASARWAIRHPVASVDAVVDQATRPFELRAKYMRRWIASLVAVAPLLGLLGTVGGMIETFDAMADGALHRAGGGGIAGGISEALLTTQLGLTVAVPGLLLSRALNRREDALMAALKRHKETLRQNHSSR